MSISERKKINYTVACVNEFSKYYNMNQKDAFLYLFEFKGIQFLIEFYEVEHLLSFDNVIEDLTIICKNNGGDLS
ncbi:MAG: DUF3791 domain-containing protein [Bacillota bacterium]|nr:DUF3791 domain-containing protein [Bacillota bacterium]